MAEINHVAVLGGGIMGAGIAGFFADRGYECSIYDLTLELAQGALDKLNDPKAKVPLILSPRSLKRIKPLALAQMKDELPKADLLIEAVPEVMSIKRKGFADVDQYRKQGSIIATNTSGLSLAEMCEGFSQDLRENFIGIHFFNPVRYMALVEVIPGPVTKKEVCDQVFELFLKAGKRPIVGRDTPNFVANRVGIYSLMWTLELARKYDLTVEEVDLITGEALARPKSATFRLCDMVGIDTLFHASKNSYDHCPQDQDRRLFDPPAFITKMIEMKRMGDKTGKGFYQKLKAEKGKGGGDDEEAPKKGGKPSLLALDLKTLEYRPKTEPKNDCVRYAKTFSKPADRLVAMCTYGEDDRISKFSRELVLGVAAYAFRRVGEVADDAETVDNAMKWGFGHEVGPLEALDALGLHRALRMMESVGISVPEGLRKIAEEQGRIYPAEPKAPPARVLSLAWQRRQGKVVRENLNARLVDLGDQVLCVELDAKMVPTMNPVDDYVMAMMEQAHEEVRSGKFKALVVSNQAANFCAGAQLNAVLDLAKAKRLDQLRAMAAMLQKVNLMNLHAPFPVVTAPHGLTLGGGLEIALGGQARVAAAELYAGLVEVGVGVVPAGGGCYLLLRQLINKMAKANPGPMPPVMAAFDLIGFGKVSSSAFDAQEKAMLTKNDVICFSKDEQIRQAKELALKMLAGHKPIEKQDLLLPGPGGYLVMADSIESFVRQGKITPYSGRIAMVQARILTGGPTASPAAPVSEETVLELEREGFVELCADKMTQDRMAFMLKKGKPLIN
ncbi:MAG TPA: 3-hydroxyacyl-CoA dehydrogenase NAD-binding domain-containing protein [Myxococcales bacterium]|jgi:3-hydroxyacyl-CoA dehydrogenase